MATTITYTPYGSTVPSTFTLPGPAWANEAGYVDGDEIGYAKDGTPHSYRQFRKRHKVLKWNGLSTANKNLLEAVYYSGAAFALSDAADPDNAFAACLFLNAPKCTPQAVNVWQVDAEIREV